MTIGVMIAEMNWEEVIPFVEKQLGAEHADVADVTIYVVCVDI